MFEEWKKYILLIQTIKNFQKHSFMREETWKGLWLQLCRVTEKRSSIQASGNCKRSHKLAMAKNSNQCLDVWWNPMNPQGNEQNLRNRKTWRSHCWVRINFDNASHFGAQVHPNTDSNEDSGRKKLPWRRNGRSSKRFQPGSWTRLWAKGGYSGSTQRQKESQRCFIDKQCHVKNAALEPNLQNYEGSVVLLVDIVKDDSEPYAAFTEQGSSASQMTAPKIMDVVARLPGCEGQVADAVSANTEVKMEDALELLKIPKSECPDIWIRLPRHTWPKSWGKLKIP